MRKGGDTLQAEESVPKGDLPRKASNATLSALPANCRNQLGNGLVRLRLYAGLCGWIPVEVAQRLHGESWVLRLGGIAKHGIWQRVLQERAALEPRCHAECVDTTP